MVEALSECVVGGGVRGFTAKCLRAACEMDPTSDAETIKRQIDQADIVSFDVFDTLLKRDVPDPADVFDYVQLSYEIAVGNLDFVFRPMRIEAEKEARETAGKNEITLQDIYSHIPIRDSLKNRLAELEISAEVKLSRTNEPVKELYEYAVRKGKRVVCTSDMYLPRRVVERLLDAAGFRDHRLFLSSDIGKRKIDGGLYVTLLNELGVSPGNMLHIGDSFRPDYLEARKLGINSILIPRKLDSALEAARNMPRNDCIEARISQSVQDNLAVGKGYYYRFGVRALGPVLIELCHHIRCGMMARRQTDIYFLARDGYLVKKAFDFLYPEIAPSSHYLYVSRKAIGTPSIYGLDDVIEVGSSTRQIDIERLLGSYGINRDLALDLMGRAGYSQGDRITKAEAIDNGKFNKLLALAAPHLLHLARHQRPCAIGYLRQEGITSAHPSAIFDLGWAGNIQGFMNRIMDREQGVEGVFGYYLALNEDKVRSDIDADALYGFDYPSMYLELVELCFSSREGTTVGYARSDDGTCVPVLSPYEYRDSFEAHIVSDIQKGAIDYVKRLTELIDPNLFCDKLGSGAFSYFRAVGTAPTIEDVEHFASMRFEDNGELCRLADPKGLSYYLLHPMGFKNDLETARWKPAFLKKLFKVPFPYYRVLIWLKKAVRAARHG